MDVINRGVAIIKPKQAYLDWATSLPDQTDPVTLEELRTDCTAILIPELDDPGEVEDWLADQYPQIFEMELAAWYHDPDVWPTNRSFQTFREWFDIDVHSLVLDAVAGRIRKDAY